MYKFMFFIICSILSIHVLAQDIRNLYDPDVIQGETLETDIKTQYTGEYQIVLRHLHWKDVHWWLGDSSKYISYSFECVSFPFIPMGFPVCLSPNPPFYRHFSVILDEDIDDDLHHPLYGSGEGWIYNNTGVKIFRKTNPIGFSSAADNWVISQPTSLVSNAFAAEIVAGFENILLPHSIIKVTLNVHNNVNFESPIAMQISWIYDNTRGRMRNYPFIDHNIGTIERKDYDVCFVPEFHYYGYPNETLHSYNEQSNSIWYTGASPSDMNLPPEGSINYYSPEDLGINNKHPYYPSANNFGFPGPNFYYYYPAPYALLVAPLTNIAGSRYAGYPIDSGSTSDVEWGIEHEYSIQYAIDLNNINPTEKIIYNPSKVTINDNLTFPEGYKFLTVHGQYPDKSWVMYNNVDNFEDLRDVLCPSDQIDSQGNFLSEYVISNGYTLTIEENVTIMDAKFTGGGTIKYNPYEVSGNFEIKSGPTQIYKIESDLTITQGQHFVWENDVELLAGNLTIENGASLTINEKVLIAPVTRIVVERGGMLLLNGGTLTSQDDKMWQGIEVWGDPAFPSTEQYQGAVYIINGGTIENAVMGIRTVKVLMDEDNEELVLYKYAGGIVKASNANFINNQTAVSFYKYPAAGYSHQYSGFFTNNTSFETNSNYIGTYGPSYFIRMNDINRVGFANCSFINTDAQNTHSGIYSFNSQFHIKGSSSGGSGSNSLFKGLNYGVYALASTPNRFPDISHTVFEECTNGIYLSGISYAQVNYCSFNPSAGQLAGYGLYLDGCRNYWVEGNEFNHAGTGSLVGIVVNDTRPTGPEMIYRNYFTDLYMGIMALNRNRTRSGEGLVLKCNEYVNTYWNQVVYFEDIFLTPEVGIAQYQGSPGEQPDAPAGNRFSWTGPLGTPTDIDNQASYITYYHHVHPDFNLKPEYYTESVTIAPNEDSDWLPEESCPSNPDPGGGGSGGGGLDDSGELRLLIASSEQQADSLGQLIQSLEDAGDTPGLTWTVDMSVPNQAYEVYNQLMGASPFVSDTVMAAAIQKESVMVDAMIRDVMVANPESAKEDHLLELLGERLNPLPEYMLGQILQGRSLVSVYGELKSKQSYWLQQRSLAMNRLKVNYLADTTNPGASLDTLAMLLTEENTADARYQLAMLHAGRNNWTDAMAVLNAIPQYFTLGQDGQQSHQDMVSFMGVLQQMDDSLPDSTQAAALFGLIGQEAGKAPVYARNILIAAGLLAYEEPMIFPDLYKSSKEIEFERLVKLADEQRMIEVFPNPAGSYFIVKWEVEKPADNMEVRLTSSTGQAVMQIPVSGNENQQIVPTQGIKAGVYVVSLHSGGKILDSVKITIVQ